MDITKRKVVEAAPRASEKWYKQLLEAVTDYIYTVRIEAGQPVSTSHSPGCVAVTGYTAAEYEANPDLWYRMVPEADQATVVAQINNILAGEESPPFEHRIIHKDGSIRWVKNTWVPRYDEAGHLVAYEGLISDVTERKQAEEALAAERNLLRTLIDTLPDYIFVKDAQSRFVINNKAHLHILGAKTQDEVIGKSDFDIFPHELAAQYFADERAVIAGQSLVNREEATITPQGHRPWLLTTKVPLRDSGGQVVGLVGVSRDITERKRVEAALSESQHFSQQIAETAPFLIYVYDLIEQRSVYVNHQVSKMLGYTPEEFQALGRDLLDELVYPDDRWVAIRHIKRVAADQSDNIFDTEYRIRRANGQWRWFHTRNVVFTRDQTGKPEQILGMAEDITERKWIEEILKTYGRVLESMAEGVIVADEHELIYFTNPAFEAMFGYQPGELIGQPTSILNLDPPATQRQFATEIRKALQTTGVWHGEFRNRKKDGTPFVTASRISILDMQDKRYLVSVQEDITERKQAEVEKARLFKEVSRQREQLRALTRRLAEVQENERKALARELHDQIGQNLTALGLNLNIVRAQIPAALPLAEMLYARLDDALVMVQETTRRIRDVMANLRPPVLDDYGLITAFKWYGNQFAERANCRVIVRGEEPSPRLTTLVENTLFRIVQEALTNVAKHAQATEVVVSLEQENGLIRMVIADNGLGFEPGELVEPGERQSWGMLTMSERAEAVGGCCRIESRSGQGTRVVVEVTR
jgi:PAS domain S-box-containing protein